MGASVLADVLTPVTTVDSDASVYISCAHQLMVLVGFYLLLLCCHDGRYCVRLMAI